MPSEPDHYKVLSIAPGASAQEIKRAFRRLAFQYHPDRNQADQETNKRMQEINEAYATLSDPMKRREYDLPRGYCIVPKFKKGSKVTVGFNSNSPYRDHTGFVDREPMADTFRFWYAVRFEAKNMARVSRFAEEELEEASE